MASDTIIKFKDSAIYQQDKQVLSEVNLEIKKGEFIFLIGKVGSGKTSLLKTIYADLPLKKGKAISAGFKLHDLKREQVPYLRRKLGIVFQDFQLLSDRNVHQNLGFVLEATGWRNKQDISRQIVNVLESVGLKDKQFKMPHELSGGEQQRVVIARALLNDPDIILADEPTGNLDPDTTNGIMELLMEIKNIGKAVLMATHNHALIRKHDARILKCEGARLTEVIDDKAIDFSELLSK